MSETPQIKNPDDITTDEESRHVKTVVMGRLGPSTWLNSISKVASFIGGPLMSTGLGLAGIKFFGAHSVALGVSAVMATPAVGIIAAAIVFCTVAIAADYVASRIYQGCNFDNLEANAKSTAHHLVKEIKANNMCMTTGQSASPCHAQDEQQQGGSSWATRIEGQRQLALAAASNRVPS